MTEGVTDQASLKGFAATIDVPKPFVTDTVDAVPLSDFENARSPQPKCASDYVNALILNEAKEVLILPTPNLYSGRICWQLIGGGIEQDENPLTAVQRILHAHTGYVTNDWTYLSSYLSDSCGYVGAGHFFCAQKVKQTAALIPQTASSAAQWIPLKELRYALLDGRIASISHATTISLALLTILK
ncbi:MAG: NUDIX domain-containing protein [Anaerolineae bacterium]|nr:NUDIX domain-containing protein [Anaerolineae bacterium]